MGFEFSVGSKLLRFTHHVLFQINNHGRVDRLVLKGAGTGVYVFGVAVFDPAVTFMNVTKDV